ncbi:DNA polymerase epsilon subunit 2-like isoform X1 [Pomacea canaliculata]|uniref:DNA polymerase epsilon subunit 2-like isoform X1 n=1 Tax=Pomacea canaliculata TaxID=400727 RepID=UPI000D735F4D|nr:DNA polymerase epsilon subunit 2-like isoform X1 [Pomacea canaliculata]
MAGKLKLEINTAFKMHGLTLRSDACKYLVDVLLPVNEVEREDVLDKIIDVIQKQPLSSSLIQRSICENAVQECQAEHEDSEISLLVFDAFSVPRFTYVQDRKKFVMSSSLGLPDPALHGTALDKAALFLDRYSVLHQRTLRHDLFMKPALGSLPDDHSKKFQLQPVEYLVGSTARLQDVIVLGMLTQLKEGKWFLEDPTGTIQLDLSQASFHNGLFTDNSFVLAEGWYEDNIFHVEAFGFPPAEPASTTRAYFGNLNFFGGSSSTCSKSSAKLRKLEEENPDAMLVFVADLWLDNAKVMEKLRELFSGYSDFPPLAFILCGHFLSCPAGQSHIKELKEGFRTLSEIITEFPPLLSSSKFIFVPGPEDAGHPSIFPRPAIPNSITKEFRQKVPGAVFTSNPCRLQYCTKEIVVFREDIVTKMCRNCVRFPTDADIPLHFTKSVISQAHLCPLPLHVCPVYWAYDAGLRLYPLPDLVVCADKFDPFTQSHADCTVTNPGSFPRSDFSFKVYYPVSGEVQDSRIPG